jgi:hypothetical protein
MIAVQKKGNKWYLHEIAFVGIAKSENIWYYVTKILMQMIFARDNTIYPHKSRSAQTDIKEEEI